MLIENLKLIATKDQVKIAVWEIFDSEKSHQLSDNTANRGQNIFLTHGTFSDKKTCLRIAEYLANLGHHCYIMEWRGHGSSSTPKDDFTFETVATYDYEATFRHFFDDLTLDNLHCITHSGGGACLTMFLIQNPHYIHKINSITLFACQVYGAIINPANHFKILSAKLFTRVLGYIPAQKLNLGPINESHHTMNQWFDWNLHRNFQSCFIKHEDIDSSGIKSSVFIDSTDRHSLADNADSANHAFVDYRQYMPTITTPIYAISAKGDSFISPTQGCKRLFNDFNNPTNVFREYARRHGDLDDYNHSRILNSRPAAKEIWPTVAAWIDEHSL